ncbi:DUF2059 domain-containing protein [Parasphingopyxis algicola]|uniref:DUF2059 domain-containing protein n=1 Tax=Parasphingopyxis algicola TaxID=2026624 RepID=UPI0015A1BB53|nr:DUF2059 domain-containing protein [Parasphingopyxis algicola]QLC24954.1 DUF2059 domain-containing protein [Parasphingopyxis algicola]
MAVLVALLSTPASVAAQTPPAPAAAEALDPDRLEKARELLDLVMPPAQRNQMILAMLEPTMTNIEQGLMQSPRFMEAMQEDPEAQQRFLAFLQQQRVETGELMVATLPGLVEAMTRAYARRFTVRQLRDMIDFFERNTGRAYLAEAATIMADPDIAAWQRNTMARAMTMMDDDIEALMADVGADSGETAARPSRPVTSSNLDAMRGGGEPEESTETETEE